MKAKSNSSEEVISGLASALAKWKANERIRPFWDYAAKQSHRIVNLPSDIAKKLAEGFARGLVNNVN